MKLHTMLTAALLGSLLTGCGMSRETFRVDTVPAGATVRINGEEIGTTPLSTRLVSMDVYNVEIERFGYRPEQIEVNSQLSQSAVSGVRVNALVTRGYYSTLSPNPIELELILDLIPREDNAPRTWEEFSKRLTQVDQWFREDRISAAIRDHMRDQLIAFYE